MFLNLGPSLRVRLPRVCLLLLGSQSWHHVALDAGVEFAKFHLLALRPQLNLVAVLRELDVNSPDGHRRLRVAPLKRRRNNVRREQRSFRGIVHNDLIGDDRIDDRTGRLGAAGIQPDCERCGCKHHEHPLHEHPPNAIIQCRSAVSGHTSKTGEMLGTRSGKCCDSNHMVNRHRRERDRVWRLSAPPRGRTHDSPHLNPLPLYGCRCNTWVAISGQNSRNVLVNASRPIAHPNLTARAPSVRSWLG